MPGQAHFLFDPLEQAKFEVFAHVMHDAIPENMVVIQNSPNYWFEGLGYFLQRLAPLVDVQLSDFSKMRFFDWVLTNVPTIAIPLSWIMR